MSEEHVVVQHARHARRRGHVDDELRQLRLERAGPVARELLAVRRLGAAVLVLGRGEIAPLLTLDTESPASVVSCVYRARERARTLRDVISTEMWEALNSFYLSLGRYDLEAALATFDGGRIVVNVVDMPIKCPVAPLEFCFLADWYFTERGIRDRVQLTYVTPLDGAFTKPVASKRLGGMLAEKGIELVTEFNTGSVDGAAGTLTSYDGRVVAFDLAVVVPLHSGAAYVGRSPGLGDELNFVPTDEHTLQSKIRPNVFVIGDAANVPTSKAGSVTHFEGEALVENIGRYLAGEALDASFDGHTNCFIESGFGKALLIDFNYDTEPLPGRYPSGVGLPLLKESHLNHLGKLMFQWLYWHSLLPGRDIPGVSSQMPIHGKKQELSRS